MSEEKTMFKEYGIKYDASYMLTAYAKRSFETELIDYMNVRDCTNIYNFLIEEYDVQHMAEEHCFVFVFKGGIGNRLRRWRTARRAVFFAG